MNEPSLRRGNRLVRCSVERHETLTGRKSAERRVDLFVCNERRIARVVRRVASSQGCSVCLRWGGSRANGSDCIYPKKEGVAFLSPTLRTGSIERGFLSRLIHFILKVYRSFRLLHLRLELSPNPRVDKPVTGQLCCRKADGAFDSPQALLSSAPPVRLWMDREWQRDVPLSHRGNRMAGPWSTRCLGRRTLL